MVPKWILSCSELRELQQETSLVRDALIGRLWDLSVEDCEKGFLLGMGDPMMFMFAYPF